MRIVVFQSWERSMVKTKYQPEEIQAWLKMQANGSSLAEIASHVGVTRATIAGALHRATGGTKVPRGKRVKKDKAEKVKPAGPKNPVRPDMKRPDKPGVDLLELEAKQCHFPVTHDRPYKFCGEQTNGQIYCDHHYALTHTPATIDATSPLYVSERIAAS